MSYGFKDFSHFFKDIRGARKSDMSNRVIVYYLDISNNLQKYTGSYSASLDCVEVPPLNKQVHLNKKGTYYDPENKEKFILNSHNMACAFRPEQEKQDYLSGEQVEGILKAGLFDRVVKPNMTLAVIGFVLGIAVTAFLVSTVFLLGMFI